MLRPTPPSRRIGRAVLIVAVTAVVSVSWPSVSQGQVLPAQPQVFLDTTYAPPSGGVISVPAGGDFQAALNAALPGQIIELEAGATFAAPPGGFVLPAKATPDPVPPGWNPWIYIRSSAYASLPPPGTRVSPDQAGLMPRIVTQDDLPAIRTGFDPSVHWVAESPCSPSPGDGCPAHHYRFVGIEITKIAETARVVNLVKLETLDPSTLDEVQQSLSQVPTDIVFDRCYIHGTPTTSARRGIVMNSARTVVIDSYLSDIHELGRGDASTIIGWNGPGPFKIVNNYLEAAAVNVMFGGGGPAKILNLVPADIEIRRNHFFKPLSWKTPAPVPPDFTEWPVKNLFELKNARRVLVDGNVFENNWTQADQGGFAIVFTPRNEDGTNPWSVVSDVTFTNNIIRSSTAGIYLLGSDDNHSSLQLQRVLIQNNLFFDIGKFPDTVYGMFTGMLFLLKNGTADVTIDHNTAFQSGPILYSDGPLTWPPSSRPVHTGFSFSNTVVPNDRYGFGCEGFALGEASIDGCMPGATVWQNAIYGPWAPDPATDMTPKSYGYLQQTNYFLPSVHQVRFVDPANCDFRPEDKGRLHDKDVGVNQDALEVALGQTVLSIWPVAPFCG